MFSLIIPLTPAPSSFLSRFYSQSFSATGRREGLFALADLVLGFWVRPRILFGGAMKITSELYINPAELTFSFSRSSGAGGQNVNKVNTRVTLSFDLQASTSLNDEQRQRISRRLARRINRRGVLRISSDVHRTQEANRKEVLERFAQLLKEAVRVERPRKRTRIPARERGRRLEQKKRRSRIKQLRSRKIDRE